MQPKPEEPRTSKISEFCNGKNRPKKRSQNVCALLVWPPYASCTDFTPAKATSNAGGLWYLGILTSL